MGKWLHTTYDVENLNIHIENSYLITNKKEIYEYVEMLTGFSDFQKMVEKGFTRSIKSMYREWVSHNVLYRWGYKKERTGSVDLDQKESLLRRICYWFLSKF